MLLFLSLLSYLKNKFGITYKSYEDGPSGPVTPKTISNAVATKSISEKPYQALSVKMHRKLVRENGKRLNEIDEYMRPLFSKMFPDLSESFVTSASDQDTDPKILSLLLEYAAKDSSTMKLLAEKFSDGGFVYRYARNEKKGHSSNPRLAKGGLQIYEAGSDRYFNFDIRYFVDSESDMNDPYESVISGKVILMKSFFVFFGVEDEKHNPFFMVMKAELQGTRFKGLILRKHPTKSYFASRVMISTDIETAEEKTGKFRASDLPEVNDRQLALIKNIVANGGESILML